MGRSVLRFAKTYASTCKALRLGPNQVEPTCPDYTWNKSLTLSMRNCCRCQVLDASTGKRTCADVCNPASAEHPRHRSQSFRSHVCWSSCSTRGGQFGSVQNYFLMFREETVSASQRILLLTLHVPFDVVRFCRVALSVNAATPAALNLRFSSRLCWRQQ